MNGVCVDININMALIADLLIEDDVDLASCFVASLKDIGYVLTLYM